MRSNSFYLTRLKQQTLMHRGVGCVIITFFFFPLMVLLMLWKCFEALIRLYLASLTPGLCSPLVNLQVA